MNLKTIFAITILKFLLISCGGRNCCDQSVDKWIADAPFVLEEFRKIETELKNNPEFVKEFSFKNQFSLMIKDTNKYFSHHNLPSLKKWFKDGRDYIIIMDGDTNVCYKQCIHNNATAYGKIGNKREDVKKYKTGVVIVDSMNLKGNWFGIVTTCENCAN
jgi:hypothetical protein